MKRMRPFLRYLGLISLTFSFVSCSSGGRNKGVKLDGTAFPSLAAYKVVTVTAFTLGPKVKADPAIGAQMADGIARRLGSDFGRVFQQVRTGAPLGQDNEVVILGTITEYNPGTDGGAGGALGIGAASLNGVMRLQDASDTEDLATGKFDELRTTSGLSGMSQNLGELITNTEGAIAFTVARAKGWKPAGSP